jgi:hydrogenase expression/formation protein HypC
VDVDGNQLDISIRLTPEVQKGQFVLVHAGFAMEIIDESLAVETMDLLKELQKYRELGI